ncbi:MAG: hypothetical protein ABR991_13715 [Terracidiphilus sp.]
MNNTLKVAVLLSMAFLCCEGFAARAISQQSDQGTTTMQPDDSKSVSIATLHQGTPVPLAFAVSVNSKTVKVGDTVPLVLTQDLVIDGGTVAKAGAIAVGEIAAVKNAKFNGRSGALSIRLNTLRAGEVKIKLSASKPKDGDTEVHYSRPFHLKFPMGVLRTGDDVEIRQGTALTVYVAEDISLPAAHFTRLDMPEHHLFVITEEAQVEAALAPRLPSQPSAAAGIILVNEYC